MTKLSDTQRIILSTASQHEKGIAQAPKSLPPGARNAVFRSLISRNLLIEINAPRELIGLGWRQDEDGTWIIARITDDGLRAIGIDPNDGDTAPQGGDDAAPRGDDAPAEEPAQGAPTAEEEAEMEDDRPRHERLGIPDSTIYGPEDETNGREQDLALLDQDLASPAQPRGLRAAAQRVLAAWEDEANQRYDLSAAMDALRTALAGKPPRAPRQPGAPREGTKQAQVLTMLRRPEGATVAQVAEATGWAAHTVRGFFAGLKKKGHEVQVLERVRQVGPNKQGAAGSYTIYHLAG